MKKDKYNQMYELCKGLRDMLESPANQDFFAKLEKERTNRTPTKEPE